MKWLDFDNEKYEKGYKPFKLTAENIRKNVGKKIVYLRLQDVDVARGYCFPKYGVIMEKRYSQLIFENHNSVDIRDVIECGIEI